jgi:hypothetical protein
MARFHLANWRGPIPNMNTGGMVRPLRGLVLHIQEGTEAGTDATFHDPNLANPRSAHFGNPQAGRLDQWVDTNDMAWAQVAGNPQWISLENEGFSGATGYTLNENQLNNAATLLAWLNLTEGVPMQLTNTPFDTGLGYHSMGGAAWGPTACPGPKIIAQRADIVARAQHLVSNPIISGINPSSGPVGSNVVITGSALSFTTGVAFGLVSVTDLNVDSDTQLTVKVPPGFGLVPITITTLVGVVVSVPLPGILFTYV